MKKVAALAVGFLILIGAVFLYNSIFTKEIRSLGKDPESSTQEVKRVNFIHWGYFPEEVFNRFREENPGIAVNYQQLDKENYSKMLKTRIASGDEIDIMGVMENDYNDFVYRNYLLDLTGRKYLENYPDEVRAAVRLLSKKDKEYAVSYKSYFYGIWYNKILFNRYNLKVPRSYPEFLQTCETLKNAGVSPLILGARDDWAAGYLYFLRLLKVIDNNRDWFEGLDALRYNWTDTDVEKAFKETEDFIKKGYINKNSINLTYQQAFYEFTVGRAAMVMTSDSSVNLVREDIDKACDPGIFPIPYNNTGDTTSIPGSSTGLLMGIFPESKNINEADLLLDFISRKEIAQIYCDITMSVPNVKGVNTAGLRYNDLWEPLRKSKSIDPISNRLSTEAQRVFNKSAKNLIAGSVTYKDIVRELQAAGQ